MKHAEARRQARAVILQCLREQRRPMVVAALSLAGVVAAELLTPWPMKIIIDHILLGHPLPATLSALSPLLAQGAWPALVAMAACIAAVALVSGGLSYLQLYSSAQVGHHITWRLRSLLFAHLQRMSLAFHRDARSGELVAKVAGDTNLLREMFAEWALTLARHALTLTTMLAVMLMMNPRLALVVLSTLPPLLAVIFVLNRRVKASAQAQRAQEGRMNSRLNEVLSSMALVQAFGREQHEEGRFQREIRENYESGMRATRANGAVVKAIAVISAAGIAITVLMGASEVLTGRLTPGELLIFVAYVEGMFKPVRDLGKLSSKMARASVSLGRVGEILALRPDVEDAPDALELGATAGEIVFEDVSFGYDPARPVLQALNLRIAAGEHVALVGASGAGKSTLVNLLLRLYEPSSGRILIDGVDIRRYSRTSLRRQLGIVLQDNSLLFAVSVRENIAYGRPDAPAEAIEAAARAAHAHEFIATLPEGYDTELGERAANLSGGQRQRLCLARALVKEPSVLVMDEPTSAVDPASAHAIHAAVRAFHGRRTLIVIAHDHAELARYDRVLTLNNGRLTEARPAAEARPAGRPAVPPATPMERRRA